MIRLKFQRIDVAMQPIFVGFSRKITYNMYFCGFIHRTDLLDAGGWWRSRAG